MSHFTQWLHQLQFGNLIDLVLIVASSLLCITVHETSHGLAAWQMGDDTAKRQGRLSLNPLRHVDPIGLILMAVARFGWAKPVPVDMRKFRNPKAGMAITALAGPISNVLLMMLAAILRAFILSVYTQYTIPIFEYAALFLEYTLVLSAGLAVFNLFPVPPLDGSKVLFSVLPDRVYMKFMRYERYGMLLLAILLFTNVLDRPLIYLRGFLLQLANFVAEPVYFLLVRLFMR